MYRKHPPFLPFSSLFTIFFCFFTSFSSLSAFAEPSPTGSSAVPSVPTTSIPASVPVGEDSVSRFSPRWSSLFIETFFSIPRAILGNKFPGAWETVIEVDETAEAEAAAPAVAASGSSQSAQLSQTQQNLLRRAKEVLSDTNVYFGTQATLSYQFNSFFVLSAAFEASLIKISDEFMAEFRGSLRPGLLITDRLKAYVGGGLAKSRGICLDEACIQNPLKEAHLLAEFEIGTQLLLSSFVSLNTFYRMSYDLDSPSNASPSIWHRFDVTLNLGIPVIEF